MKWDDYEKQIFLYLKQVYPDTTILYNQKIRGKNSRQERQIDILIESYIAGKKIRIIVDTKYFKTKIDVKDVESFVSMVQDVDAKQGILITNMGYTQAAINTAYHGPTDIELDILNFDELRNFQGHGAIVYSGEYGAILPAPFGWIVDGAKRIEMLATLYQRGLDFDQAKANKEFIYLNLFKKENNINSIQDLVDFQEIETKARFPGALFEYDRSIDRPDKAKTALRTIAVAHYPTEEYTGFVEFDEFFLFFVLFTPIELKSKNLRKLETLLQRVLPISVNQESIYYNKLNLLSKEFEVLTDDQDKANSLILQGEVLFKLKQYHDADKKFAESISILPTSYGAFKGRLSIALVTDGLRSEIPERLVEIINLGPTNPVILSDIISIYRSANRLPDVVGALLDLIEKFKDNHETIGNIYFNIAQSITFYDRNPKIAKKYFKLAEGHFKKCLPADHYVFDVIAESLNLLKNIN